MAKAGTAFTSRRGRDEGRRSIFRGKRHWKSGPITDVGEAAFQRSRVRLAKLVRRDPVDISNSDVIEATSRGWPETEAYIRTNFPDVK